MVPADAQVPAPIDYIGTYITLPEYLLPELPEEDWALEEVVAYLADGHDRETMIVSLALLNGLSSDGDKLPRLTEEFQSVLRAEVRDRFDAAMSSTGAGLGRMLVARHPILAGIRYLLTHPPKEQARSELPPMVAAILFTQAVAATLNAEPERSEETILGHPVHLVLEVVRSGLLYQHEDTYATIDRLVRLWRDYGSRVSRYRLRARPAELVQQASGLEVEDILALGFAFLAHSMQLEPGKPPYLRHDLGSRMPEERIAAFLELVSATPKKLGAAFKGRKSRYDFLPFQEKPVLRTDKGFLVLDEGYLWDRVTSGLYWIVHDHEKRRSDRDRLRWNQAFSEMVELMVEDQLRQLAPPLLSASGGTTFYTEEDFARAFARKRSDTGIDFGASFALFEIVSGQPSVPVRVQGEAKKLFEDTERLVIKKCRQLHETAMALFADEAALTCHEPRGALRITPVVVVAGGFPLNPFTLELVESMLREERLLDDPRMDKLAIIDLGELEMLEGVAEQGHGVPKLLVEWQHSSLRNVALRNFLIRNYGTISNFRPSRMEDRVDRTFKDVIARLQLPDEDGGESEPESGAA